MNSKAVARTVRLLTSLLLGMQAYGAHLGGAHAEQETSEGERLAEAAYDAFQVGNYTKALDKFRQAAPHFPRCPSTKIWTARTLEKLGRTGEALELYEALMQEEARADELPSCTEARQESADAKQRLAGTVGWLDLDISGLQAPLTQVTVEPHGNPGASRKHTREPYLPAPFELPASGKLIAGTWPLPRVP